jgi:hypothetical protein
MIIDCSMEKEMSLIVKHNKAAAVGIKLAKDNC